MTTLAELGDHVTTELRRRVDDLVAAVENEATDFTEIGQLADDVGDLTTTISEIYGDIERILMDGLQGNRGSKQPTHDSERQDERQSNQREQQLRQPDSAGEDVTREELLDRARELNVHGRSSMAKDELAQAVEAEESLTKEQLLERARLAGIEGRASMTKEELRSALHDAGV
jgi:hypothetical protein